MISWRLEYNSMTLHYHTAETTFTIIIPTYQEAKNIPALVARIAALQFPPESFEVYLMDDDSQDGIVEVVQQLKQQYPWLKLIVRQHDRSWANSVLQGIKLARFSNLIFMDADLSHPPENIPDMLALLNKPNVDMVIGSRYMQGGGVDDKWPLYRRAISRLATMIIRPLLPGPIKDPLSGYLAIKRERYAMNGESWKPIGTKIGLEIIVKSYIKNIIEIPIYFSQRQYGESKLMSMKIARSFVKQIASLWGYKLFLRHSGGYGN